MGLGFVLDLSGPLAYRVVGSLLVHLYASPVSYDALNLFKSRWAVFEDQDGELDLGYKPSRCLRLFQPLCGLPDVLSRRSWKDQTVIQHSSQTDVPWLQVAPYF